MFEVRWRRARPWLLVLCAARVRARVRRHARGNRFRAKRRRKWRRWRRRFHAHPSAASARVPHLRADRRDLRMRRSTQLVRSADAILITTGLQGDRAADHPGRARIEGEERHRARRRSVARKKQPLERRAPVLRCRPALRRAVFPHRRQGRQPRSGRRGIREISAARRLDSGARLLAEPQPGESAVTARAHARARRRVPARADHAVAEAADGAHPPRQPMDRR